MGKRNRPGREERGNGGDSGARKPGQSEMRLEYDSQERHYPGIGYC